MRRRSISNTAAFTDRSDLKAELIEPIGQKETAGVTGGFRNLDLKEKISESDPGGRTVRPDEWVLRLRSFHGVLESGVAAIADNAADQTDDDEGEGDDGHWTIGLVDWLVGWDEERRAWNLSFFRFTSRH